MVSKTEPDTKSRPWVTMRSRLIVLILVVLIVSSGSLYYINTPIFYYGYVAFSVLMILIVVYIFIHFTQAPPELFTNGKVDEDQTSTGLERVFKAEKRYKTKEQQINEEPEQSRTRKLRGVRTKTQETSSKSAKKFKIGSIPLEETIFTEKYDMLKKGEDTDSVSETKKVTTFLCPTCGSKELYYEAGLISGYKYHCKDCDYIGSFVIEKDFKVVD
jgi:predicted RNA-binding Zn-ribbon protein involved in translation (DUF1610 family)